VAFIGPAARTFLDAFEDPWRGATGVAAMPDLERDIIDIFGVREAVLRALGTEVTGLPAIPGVGAPYEWDRLISAHAARQHPDAIVFLSCFGTSDPLVVAPIAGVSCDPVALLQLARDLAARDRDEPDSREAGVSAWYAIPIGERVWRLRVDEQEHGRNRGELWIAPPLLVQGLGGDIEQVLAGRQRRISFDPELAP